MTSAPTSCIRWFRDLALSDLPLVGGKNASLGEMARSLTPLGVRIPEGFADEGLPRGLAESMDARVRLLGADARALGRAIAVHGGRVSLRTAVALAAGLDEDRVFAAIAVLEREDILVGAGERWDKQLLGVYFLVTVVIFETSTKIVGGVVLPDGTSEYPRLLSSLLITSSVC